MDESPFDQDFCNFLEYHLSAAFYNTRNDKFRILWCDGILMPDDEQQLTIANICKNKQIVTRGWFGYDGQGPYWFAIIFGAKALNTYVEGLDLTDCVPSDETVDWVTVDMENRNIELYLQ
jgi:hypothetical protein